MTGQRERVPGSRRPATWPTSYQCPPSPPPPWPPGSSHRGHTSPLYPWARGSADAEAVVRTGRRRRSGGGARRSSLDSARAPRGRTARPHVGRVGAPPARARRSRRDLVPARALRECGVEYDALRTAIDESHDTRPAPRSWRTQPPSFLRPRGTGGRTRGRAGRGSGPSTSCSRSSGSRTASPAGILGKVGIWTPPRPEQAREARRERASRTPGPEPTTPLGYVRHVASAELRHLGARKSRRVPSSGRRADRLQLQPDDGVVPLGRGGETSARSCARRAGNSSPTARHGILRPGSSRRPSARGHKRGGRDSDRHPPPRGRAAAQRLPAPTHRGGRSRHGRPCDPALSVHGLLASRRPGGSRRCARSSSEFAPFDFTSATAIRFPENSRVLYLRPEPDAPFRAMTRVLVEAFPEHPPYRGKYPDPIPHATVAIADESCSTRSSAPWTDRCRSPPARPRRPCSSTARRGVVAAAPRLTSVARVGHGAAPARGRCRPPRS